MVLITWYAIYNTIKTVSFKITIFFFNLINEKRNSQILPSGRLSNCLSLIVHGMHGESKPG